MLESIPDVVDSRDFPIRDEDFDHIEAPRQLAGSEAFEPGIGAAFDQALLFLVHRVQRADLRVFVAGFHLDEQQEFPVPGDDVHLAAVRAFEIPLEDPAAAGTQESGRDIFSVFADPGAVARFAIRPGQMAG